MATHGPHPKRAGDRHASIVPYGHYRVGDGRQVVLAVQNDREWRRLCSEVLEMPALADDPRFVTNEKRLANRAELEPQVEAGLSKFTAEQAEAKLEAASVAYSRLNDVADVLSHPQVLKRDRLLNIAVPDGQGRVDVLRAPFNIEGLSEEASALPAVGEHTDAVLGELGYSGHEVAALRDRGAV
jgi:formyl-CoA transferase